MAFNKQDLIKVDFKKLTYLPKFQDSELRVKYDEFWNPELGVRAMVTVRYADGIWIAALDESGKWYGGLRFCSLDAQVEIYSICKLVDAFIEAALAAMHNPNWVPVSWMCVDHLLFIGATVEYRDPITKAWIPKLRGCGYRTNDYRADSKTLPTGYAYFNIDSTKTDDVNSDRSIRSEFEDRCPAGTDVITAIRRLADIIDERSIRADNKGNHAT